MPEGVGGHLHAVAGALGALGMDTLKEFEVPLLMCLARVFLFLTYCASPCTLDLVKDAGVAAVLWRSRVCDWRRRMMTGLKRAPSHSSTGRRCRP